MATMAMTRDHFTKAEKELRICCNDGEGDHVYQIGNIEWVDVAYRVVELFTNDKVAPILAVKMDNEVF